MLWSLNRLRHYRIRATDGSLGSVEDVFFDDLDWTVRYLVVDTAWLFGRRVVIPAAVLGTPESDGQVFPVALTEEQVRNSPDIDAAQPVYRQQEIDLHGHYGWTPYWLAAGWIRRTAPPMADSVEGDLSDARDPHLRSGLELRGYALRGTDESVGHVEDLLMEEADWAVRYLVADTRNWIPGRKVLLAPGWVSEISWPDRHVAMNMSRSEIEASPAYDPSVQLERDYEDRLHRHYGRKGYWSKQDASSGSSGAPPG